MPDIVIYLLYIILSKALNNIFVFIEAGIWTLTTKGLARHSRNQKIHLNHEKHENSRKRGDFLSTDDTDGHR